MKIEVNKGERTDEVLALVSKDGANIAFLGADRKCIMVTKNTGLYVGARNFDMWLTLHPEHTKLYKGDTITITL